MSFYFISGVKEHGGECERVPDEDAEFFSMYRSEENEPSYWVRDFGSKEEAEEGIKLAIECDK